MAYEPEHTPGEIIIYFVEDSRIGQEFMEIYVDRLYGESLGVQFKRYEDHGESYIFSTPVGKEDLCRQQIKPDKFIESVERVDGRLIRRFELYDQIVSSARDLEGQFESDVDTSGLRKLLDEWDKS